MKTIALAVLSLWLVACSSGEQQPDAGSDKPGPTGTAKPAVVKRPAVKVEPMKLPKLGLQVEVPVGSTVTDAIGGEGNMVMSTSGPFNVTIAAPDKPTTIEAAKKDAEMFKPKNFKSETLPDGWVLTYENDGSAGPNYWLTVRREIGGKAYLCDTSTVSEAQRDAALAACKSLRP